jgi:hypothetical protein
MKGDAGVARQNRRAKNERAGKASEPPVVLYLTSVSENDHAANTPSQGSTAANTSFVLLLAACRSNLLSLTLGAAH